MIRVYRLTVLLGALFGIIFMVHQGERLAAADALLSAATLGADEWVVWSRAGVGTGLLLQLFAWGAALLLILTYLRLLQVRELGPTGPFESLAPLTATLTDLQTREREQRQEKTDAVARMNRMRAIHTTILDGLPSGALTVDAGGRIATCNPAARRILRWDGESPVGRPVGDLFQGAPPPHLAGTDGAPKAAERLEFAWHPPAGEARHLGMSIAPIHTPTGLLTTVLFTDLTQLQRLQRQVAVRRHLAELGEVAAGIAHEFRNNMGAIQGYARLIGHEMADNRTGQEMVTSMIGELSNMDRLIHDLLDFSRRTEPETGPVAVEPLLQDALRIAAADFPEIPLSCRVAPGLPPLAVDDTQIRQALINLVRNACEAMVSFGGENRSTTPATGPAVTLSATLAEDPSTSGPRPSWINLTVTDAGPGIDPDTAAKLFLPFFTTKESGTGMGLAYVNKTVLAHGGEVVVGPRRGGGTTFRLRLPTIHLVADTSPSDTTPGDTTANDMTLREKQGTMH